MRSAGNRRLLWAGGLVLAVGALIASGSGALIGAESQATKLKGACEGRGTDASRLAALADLKALNTTDSRTALEELADSKNDEVATRALFAIGQADQSGGRSKLKAVYEDTKRSYGVRVAAILAWARLEAKGGSSWTTIENYAKNHYTTGSQLETAVLAAKNALFPSTGGK